MDSPDAGRNPRPGRPRLLDDDVTAERVTVRGPGDLVALLPYQLGYHPARSIVVVTMRRRRVGLVARADLPADGGEEQVVGALLPPLLREDPDAVLLVAYEDAPGDSGPAVGALAGALTRSGLRVVDVIVVRDGRWFGLLDDGSGGSAAGQPLPHPADVPAVASFVRAERSPMPTRESLGLLVAEDGRAARGVVDAIRTARAREAVGQVRRRPARVWARIVTTDDGCPAVEDLPATAVAAAACSLDDIPWRDGLIGWLSPGTVPLRELDGGVRAALRRALPALTPSPPTGRVGARLAALCRRLPDACPHEAAAVCTLAAAVFWGAGEGALAREAVDRALRLDAATSLGRLLERMLDLGVRPPGPADDAPA